MVDAAPAALVGRHAESAVLSGLLDALDAGSGAVVLLEGEGGVGKTTLAGWLVSGAAARGHRTLEGQAYALASTTPYGPLNGALRAAVRASPEVATDLPSLALLFDGLGTPPATLDPDLARTRLHDALVTLVSRLADDRPTVLLLDDLHWADSATLQVVELLAGEVASLPCLLVGTARPVEASERPEVRAALRTLRRGRSTRTITLRRLEREATAALVRRRLDGLVPEQVVDLVHERSAGTPLVVEALLGDLVDSGVLRREGRRWLLGDPPERSGAPRVAHDLIGDRIEQLGPHERDLLRSIALAGEPLGDAVLSRLHPELTDREEHLRQLVRRQLVDETTTPDGAPAWRPHHPIVGEVVVDGLGAAERGERHLAFVVALRDDAPVVTLARHHVGAGLTGADDDRVGVLVRAGRSSLERGAPVEACRTLQAALDLVEVGHGTRHRPDVLELLAEAWRRRSEHSVAEELLLRVRHERADQGDLVGESRALRRLDDARWRAAAASSPAGELDDMADRLAHAEEWRELTELLYYRYVRDGVRIADPEPAVRYLDQLRAAADRSGDRRTSLLADLAETTSTIHTVDSLKQLWDGGLADLRRAAEDQHDTQLRVVHIGLDLALCFGSRDDIARAVEAEYAYEARWGDWRSWRVNVARWLLHVADGRLDAAEEVLEERMSVPSARRTATETLLTAVTLRHRGRTDDGLAVVERARAALGDPGDDAVNVRMVDAAELWLGEAVDVEVAERHLEMAEKLWFVAGTPAYCVATHGLARLAMAPETVASWAEPLVAHGAGGGRVSAWAQTVAASAVDDGPERARLLLRAADWFDRAGFRLDGADRRIEAALAEADAVPDDLLLAAWRRAAGAGATRTADPAAAELRRRGIRLPVTVEAGDHLGLTAREREVAEAVAEGLTNREVAERLFISVRTVTSHLDHIYAKLGIGSRRELVERLRSGDGAAP